MSIIQTVNSIISTTHPIVSSRTFSYLDISIKIKSNSTSLFNGFIAKIGPHIEAISDQNLKTEKFHYNLLESDNLYKKVEDFIQHNLQNLSHEDLTMTFCSNQKGTLLVQKWKDDNFTLYKSVKTPSYLIQDLNEANTFYFIVKDGYATNPKWDKDAFVYFEHIIHKLANKNNTILVHATAVAKDNRCIIFVGEKRAGKTTMLFEICKKFGFSPISVDKVHIKFENDELNVYGFPSELRVLAGTLSKFSPYFDRDIPEEFLECEKEKLWSGESSGKVTIENENFEKFIGNEFEKSAVLTDVVFPYVAKDAEPILKSLSESAFLRSIDKSLFTPNNPEEDWWSDVGMDYVKEMEANRAVILAAIFEKCNCWQLHGAEELSIQFSDLLQPDR